MTDSAGPTKPDGSAFKAHMEALKTRNDATRKAGKQEREEHDRAQSISRRADEVGQTAALRRSEQKRSGSASLIREKKG